MRGGRAALALQFSSNLDFRTATVAEKWGLKSIETSFQTYFYSFPLQCSFYIGTVRKKPDRKSPVTRFDASLGKT